MSGVCRNVILEYRRRRNREPLQDSDAPLPDVAIQPEADTFELRNAIDAGLAELAERRPHHPARSLSRRERQRRHLLGMENDRRPISRRSFSRQRALPPHLRSKKGEILKELETLNASFEYRALNRWNA